MSALCQDVNQLCEQLTWLQGHPKQVKRLAWEGHLSVQQANVLLTECVQLATRIEAQLDKIAEHMNKTAAAEDREHDRPPLKLLPRATEAPPHRRSRLG